jgi:hypothetical protein
MVKLILRYALFVVGLYVLTLGLALIIRSSLGTSPISTLAYVVSLFTPITLGTGTLCVNTILILSQFWLIRGGVGTRRDRLEIFLQLPFSVLFSAFIDLNMYLVSDLAPSSYVDSWILLIIGCVIQAFGVALEVKPNVVAMSAEGFVKYASRRFHRNFGKTKVALDSTLVVLGVVASLGFCSGIVGVREGTLFAAMFVGILVNLINTYILSKATALLHSVNLRRRLRLRKTSDK